MGEATASAERISAEERLFSLLLALIASERGLTKDEILSTVEGYRQDFRHGQAQGALERKFERDKSSLRELGVPLETIEDPGDPGNNQSLRYRISSERYELPHDIAFSDKEMALLNLAARVWQGGSLSGESRRALLKLHSLGIEVDEPMIGYAPRIQALPAAFESINDAIFAKAIISFSYLKPGATEAEQRRVVPLAQVQHQGRWHLYANDLQREAPRTFLLSRIVGPVTAGTEPYEYPGDDFHAQALAELDAVLAANVATVSVVEGSDAHLVLARRAWADDAGVLSLNFTDLAITADELAAFGPELQVHAPKALADAVGQRLREVLAVHEPGAEQDPDPETDGRHDG